ADHLHVVAELVEHAEPRVHVHDGGNVRHPLADVLARRSFVDVLVEERLREDMVENVDFHARFAWFELIARAAHVAIRAGTAAAQNVRLAPPPWDRSTSPMIMAR